MFFFLENPTTTEISTDEMSKLQEQFNAQRARMKEIYLLKEKECVQMKQKMLLMKKELEEEKSQLVIAEYNRQKDLEDQKQEIQTLQQLLQETCEEATIANNEISVLKGENERGRQELREMKEVLVQQQQQVRFRNKVTE
jgi:Rab GTPase-binding effector protein 1